MNGNSLKRFAGVALVLPIALFTLAAPALAKEPKGDFAVYKQCPTSNPAVNLCLVVASEGGELQLGKIDVPVLRSQVFQGGIVTGEGMGPEAFAEAENGETLVPTPQVVPGGVFGLVKEGHYPWYLRNFCKNFPSNSVCKVTATFELVGPPTISRVSLLTQTGTALAEPLRMHLKNPFLGGRCYVGSAASPILVSYTSGKTSPPPPNVPIEGGVGGVEILDEGTDILIKPAAVVDNTFSVPGAEGCGGPQSLIVDAEIDQKAGLPSPAGHNTAKLVGTVFDGVAEAVTFSES
jgi:hypothetical protein